MKKSESKTRTKSILHHLNTLAAHQHLGSPLAFIGGPVPRPLSRLGILAVIIGLILVVALAQLTPFLVSFLPVWQVMLVLLMALLWIVVGFWLLVASIRQRTSMKTLLCAGGVIWSYKRSVEMIRWKDIESLWRIVTGDSAICYEIRLRDGRIVTLDSRVPGAEKLARFIEQVVISRHLAPLLQAYQQGATFKFGPLLFSTYGLWGAEHSEVLQWDQIKYVRPHKGVLTIQQKEQVAEWATIPLSTLPNVCILEAMMHAIHALHRTQAPMLERTA